MVRHWQSRLDEINDDLCVSISSFFFVIRWRGNEWLCWNRCVMLLLYSQQQECRVLAVGNKLLEQVLSHLDSARYPDNSQSIQYWFRIQHVEMYSTLNPMQSIHAALFRNKSRKITQEKPNYVPNSSSFKKIHIILKWCVPTVSSTISLCDGFPGNEILIYNYAVVIKITN